MSLKRGPTGIPCTPGPFPYAQGGQKLNAHYTWYRGEYCNYLASKRNLQEQDALDKYILAGWAPSTPPLTSSDKFVAMGSCFAEHVIAHLCNQGLDAHVFSWGAGIVNTFTVRQQLEWIFEDLNFEDSELLSHGYAASTSAARREALQIFNEATVFIITLGLAEVWRNKRTGLVFWRAVPKEQFNLQTHEFAVSTVTENLANLGVINRILCKHRPEAHIIYTLSPVPLVCTFRSVSCATANSVSKAILRAALDEFLRSHSENAKLWYWPSYEIVTEYFKDRAYEADNRHITQEAINTIMSAFVQKFVGRTK